MLTIETTQARIGIQTQQGSMSIRNPSVNSGISVTHQTIRIESTLPRVLIDQSRPFAEAGLKGNMELSQEYAAYGRSEMLKSAARIAEQGTALANFHQNPDAIADQGYSNAYEQFIHEFDIDSIPKSKPDIQVVEGTNEVTIQPGEVRNTITAVKPEISVEKTKVSVYLQQMNGIRIQNIDTRV